MCSFSYLISLFFQAEECNHVSCLHFFQSCPISTYLPHFHSYFSPFFYHLLSKAIIQVFAHLTNFLKYPVIFSVLFTHDEMQSWMDALQKTGNDQGQHGIRIHISKNFLYTSQCCITFLIQEPGFTFFHSLLWSTLETNFPSSIWSFLGLEHFEEGSVQTSLEPDLSF